MTKTISRWQFLWQVALQPIQSLRKLRNWQLWQLEEDKIAFWKANEDKITFWKSNEEKIALWMDHEATVTNAVHTELRQQERLRKFKADFDSFRNLSGTTVTRLPLRHEDIFACCDDVLEENPFDAHYLYHTAWAARILAKTRPDYHVDISSIVNFSAIVSAFIPVEFYEYRLPAVTLSNFHTGKADLLRLPFSDMSRRSVSCMHVIEHIGLGRYGEALDPDGDLKAIRELIRVLAVGGDLLVVVPVGRPRIQFNAHRIYDYAEFRDYFTGLELVEFALIPDGKAPDGLIYQVKPEFVCAQSYACGCYWFKKPHSPGGESQNAFQ
jgi:SAM-dependent methyltransferase